MTNSGQCSSSAFDLGRSATAIALAAVARLVGDGEVPLNVRTAPVDRDDVVQREPVAFDWTTAQVADAVVAGVDSAPIYRLRGETLHPGAAAGRTISVLLGMRVLVLPSMFAGSFWIGQPPRPAALGIALLVGLVVGAAVASSFRGQDLVRMALAPTLHLSTDLGPVAFSPALPGGPLFLKVSQRRGPYLDGLTPPALKKAA